MACPCATSPHVDCRNWRIAVVELGESLANLPLSDYGRVARHSGETPKSVNDRLLRFCGCRVHAVLGWHDPDRDKRYTLWVRGELRCPIRRLRLIHPSRLHNTAGFTNATWMIISAVTYPSPPR